MIQPKPKRRTPQADKIVNALKRAGGWQTRSQIAESIGKKRLTVYDIALLELLSEQGSIEVRQAEGGSREGYTWQYRSLEN